MLDGEQKYVPDDGDIENGGRPKLPVGNPSPSRDQTSTTRVAERGHGDMNKGIDRSYQAQEHPDSEGLKSVVIVEKFISQNARKADHDRCP